MHYHPRWVVSGSFGFFLLSLVMAQRLEPIEPGKYVISTDIAAKDGSTTLKYLGYSHLFNSVRLQDDSDIWTIEKPSDQPEDTSERYVKFSSSPFQEHFPRYLDSRKNWYVGIRGGTFSKPSLWRIFKTLGESYTLEVVNEENLYLGLAKRNKVRLRYQPTVFQFTPRP